MLNVSPMSRTKIVCTIGPSSQRESTLFSMMRAGLDVARLNFSHGTHTSHAKLVRLVRKTSARLQKPVAIIGDLQGPKIRLGELPEKGIFLQTGSRVVFGSHHLPVTYLNLHKDLKPGHRILIDDGLLEAVVTNIEGKKIHAKIKNVSFQRFAYYGIGCCPNNPHLSAFSWQFHFSPSSRNAVIIRNMKHSSF